MYFIPDAGAIRNTERTGYPDPEGRWWPTCPVCGVETDLLYRDMAGDIVGCEVCVRSVDPWEEEEMMRQ